ncbi:hypothetical protein DYB37_012501 [Aphanomyces astaci]|uniref:RBR-type E3 ubiquitin transferase n=2 Tax=Aphanomyces astaci TaxID=112090 RepID=A0A397DGT3_APHAT|nr:hypothetical protein DYB30_000866 [Aphanomyces astaci]RHY90942.1 hypothetical protein DYB35_009881 [Aphanomyces astaci]RHZ32053.1 hypothetical protein DYB37_012501 [Aphanomyces astaci]RHZ32757.1 hypothetical protein DYB26_000850 [Aphanomyces astaci]
MASTTTDNIVSVVEYEPSYSKPTTLEESPEQDTTEQPKTKTTPRLIVATMNVVLISPEEPSMEPLKTAPALNALVPSVDNNASTPRDCAICFETLQAKNLCGSTTCGSRFCDGCIQMYLQIKIQDGQVRRIRCPGLGCTAILSSHHIHGYVPTDLFQRYLELKDKLRSGRVCPPCGQSVTSSGRKIHCQACTATTCGDCGEPYHMFACKDVTYKSWRQHTEHDVRSCPNCHVDIEKHGGCTHMACTHCEFEFCWLCRVSWDRHTEAMCKPLAFLESESSSLGPNAPIRAVTKSVVVVAATGVAAVGIGIAAALAPPVLLFNGVKHLLHRRKQAKTLKKLEKLRTLHA